MMKKINFKAYYGLIVLSFIIGVLVSYIFFKNNNSQVQETKNEPAKLLENCATEKYLNDKYDEDKYKYTKKSIGDPPEWPTTDYRAKFESIGSLLLRWEDSDEYKQQQKARANYRIAKDKYDELWKKNYDREEHRKAQEFLCL